MKKLNFPPARKLPDPPGATGQRVEPEPLAYGGEDGLGATEKNVRDARRMWPQGKREDFERLGKRLWLDRASNTEFRQPTGNPLLAISTDATRHISVFIIDQGRLVFLQRADVSDVQQVGQPAPIISCELSHANAQPQVIW